MPISVSMVESGSAWQPISGGPGTLCSHGDPYTFFVRQGDPERLVVELEGGGCCFDKATCENGADYTRSIGPVAAKRLFLDGRGGIGNHRNAESPIANWTHVYVPYCTGDAHTGNRTASYGIHHVGLVNAHRAIDWAVANVRRPKLVLTMGTSAGAVGSYVLAPRVFDRYPLAKHYHLADSYAPVFGQTGYTGGLENWGLLDAYSRHIPLDPTSIDHWHPLVNAYMLNVTARAYPRARFSSYVSHADVIERNFYAVEGCGLDGCDWEKAMRAAFHAVDAPNFHYLIGPGALHGAMQLGAFYTQEVKGTRLVEWVADLLEDKPLESLDCRPLCGGGGLSSEDSE